MKTEKPAIVVTNVVCLIYCVIIIAILAMAVLSSSAHAADNSATTVTKKMWHLRNGDKREWDTFPEKPDASQIDIEFQGQRNTTEGTLKLRQQDAKQRWNVILNGKQLGRLRVDENDMVVYFPVPAGVMIEGKNRLQIKQDTRRRNTPDDIRVGEISFDKRTEAKALSETAVEITVVDSETGSQTPCRITIIGENGALQTVGAKSNDHLAVRPGTVYSGNGNAKFGLPAGNYAIYAGRGFEYSLDSVKITVKPGARIKKTLRIRREVPTPGYVACDTHVHTLTHSGHGDATVLERMMTLAGEGIELPIATDHNRHVNHVPFAQQTKVRQYFTPVIGNEVTTKTAHFNIFPVKDGSTPPDHSSPDWGVTLKNIFSTPGAKIAILNHARDLHGSTRPFGPKIFNEAVGENILGWPMKFNAMETINSGATQTDVLQLFRDWMALLNRGYNITPVGSSDSHDVARHFVGQGRTYIRCDDRDPGKIDINTATKNFLQGRVMVSYGLLCEIKVAGKYRSGELATISNDKIRVDVRVLGPHWVKATKVVLFANGQPIRQLDIPVPKKLPTGVKWQGGWTLPKPKHDVHLVAIATGPGVDGLYWKTAKPYQPTSTHWESNVIGCGGAVWIDADGDGRKTSAREYASKLMKISSGEISKLVTELRGYDAAVAAQAASLYHQPNRSLQTPSSRKMLKSAAPATQAGFQAFLNARRKTQIARIKTR